MRYSITQLHALDGSADDRPRRTSGLRSSRTSTVEQVCYYNRGPSGEVFVASFRCAIALRALIVPRN